MKKDEDKYDVTGTVSVRTRRAGRAVVVRPPNGTGSRQECFL